jgi:hypothetical protein
MKRPKTQPNKRPTKNGRQPPPAIVTSTGNHGGDYLRISEIQPGLLDLEIGHQCVVMIKHAIPVEILTAVLSEAFADGPEKADLPWDDAYNESLRNKVTKFPVFKSVL